MRLVVGLTYFPFFKKFTDRDVENMIIKFLNNGANSVRAFLYYDGREELMNYYEKKDGKFDLHKFSKEYFDRIDLLGRLAKKYNFILKIDVLDNCSFFRHNFDVHPFNNNIQGIKVTKPDIYTLNNKIKPYIKELFKKHWNVLKKYKSHIKLGVMNEATFQAGSQFNYTKYKPVAEFHKKMANEILIPLNIPRKYWRVNPQTDANDWIKLYHGEKGEAAWSYTMGLLGAEQGKCKNVEGEVHGVGLKKLSGIIPEIFLDHVFNPAFQEISFSDDGVNDGDGENEGNGKWGAETAEEFVKIYEKVLRKSIQKRKPLVSVEHLVRAPEKMINEIEGDMDKEILDKFIPEETTIYFKKAAQLHKQLTGENLFNHYEFIEKEPEPMPECNAGDEIKQDCPDGTYIVIKKCKNGKWVETSEECAGEPEKDCRCSYWLNECKFKTWFLCLLGLRDKKCRG